MDFVYIIIIVLNSGPGGSRVALTAPGHDETLQQCETRASLIEENPHNKRRGILDARCFAVPIGPQFD